jgi:hypothetical protein
LIFSLANPEKREFMGLQVALGRTGLSRWRSILSDCIYPPQNLTPSSSIAK